MAWSTVNIEMKMGNCATTGRQPPSGLAPAPWYSAMTSWFMRCLSFL